jgi:hypothetical protein
VIDPADAPVPTLPIATLAPAVPMPRRSRGVVVARIVGVLLASWSVFGWGGLYQTIGLALDDDGGGLYAMFALLVQAPVAMVSIFAVAILVSVSRSRRDRLVAAIMLAAPVTNLVPCGRSRPATAAS